jgi:hypothetical protein
MQHPEISARCPDIDRLADEVKAMFSDAAAVRAKKSVGLG